MSSSCSPFSLLRIIEQEFSTHFDLLTTSNGISEFKMVSECILWTGAKCKVCGCTLPGLNFFAKINALSSTRQLLSWYFILFVFLRYFICFSYVFVIPWDNPLTLFRVITARLGTPATENVDSANDISPTLSWLYYIFKQFLNFFVQIPWVSSDVISDILVARNVRIINWIFFKKKRKQNIKFRNYQHPY